jgi:NodT family efflux transporter outer membrane factor (OMF) lipoprotein
MQGIWLLTWAGCTVGPDYRPPESHVPDAWSGTGAAAVSAARITPSPPVELVQWWNTFNDPVLSSLIGRAVVSNLDLRLAEGRVRQARASRGVVAAGFWPQVDASANYVRSYDGSSPSASSSMAGSPSGTTVAARDLFQAGLDAAWELDIFGGVRRNIEASNADIQASEEDRRGVLVTLAAEVGTNYLNLRGFQQQIAIAQKNLKAQRHTAEITRKRFEAGFVSALDVASAQAQVATTESQIPSLESAAQGAIYSLSVLLGREPGALLRELSTETPIPPAPPEIPVGLPSDLIRRRPDIRRAEAQIHAATARIGVATADLFPKFSLTGAFGFSSSDLSSLANWSSRVWSFGPSVSWPIFAGGRIWWNIQVQNALEEQALIAYEKTVLTALKEVETALVAYAKELERRKSLTDAAENNARAVDLAMKRYIAGRTDFLAVLLFQGTLFQSEDSLVQSTRNLTTNLIALYKALGGGWEEEPQPGKGTPYQSIMDSFPTL